MAGKKKCRILREIRQKIAEENDIPFVTEECRYKGDCKGTCPKCESELRYLEQQLEKRRSLGKRVTVSALALGLAASVAGCRQMTNHQLEGDVPYVNPETEWEDESETAEDKRLEGTGESSEQETVNPLLDRDFDLAGAVAYDQDDDFDPSENVEPCVYGPPEMMESTEAND